MDWILDKEDEWVALEVKYTSMPNQRDAKHLATFLKEYPKASKAYVICQTPRVFELAPGIEALPWQELESLFL